MSDAPVNARPQKRRPVVGAARLTHSAPPSERHAEGDSSQGSESNVSWQLFNLSRRGGDRVRLARRAPGQEVGPAPLQPVAPAEQADERPATIRRSGTRRGSRAPGRSGTARRATPAGKQASKRPAGPRAGARRWRSPACGSRAAASAPQELQRPQAGVAEQVDQGDVAQPEADLGDDQPDLRQRGERQADLMSVCTLPAR